jgi:hypothetical protein
LKVPVSWDPFSNTLQDPLQICLSSGPAGRQAQMLF